LSIWLKKGIYEQGSAEEVFGNPSRNLTRQFLYRSMMLERILTGATADVYALCSEIRAFAAPYGFGLRSSRALDYICDELLLPIFRSSPNESIHIRFIADENGQDHMVLVAFPALNIDPLQHPAIDSLNLRLLEGFTKDLRSLRNGDGVWEVQIHL
jgi:hypothetical protein